MAGAYSLLAYELAAKPFVGTSREYQIECMKYTPENALTDDALKEYQCQYERDVFRKTGTAAMAAQTKLGWQIDDLFINILLFSECCLLIVI